MRKSVGCQQKAKIIGRKRVGYGAKGKNGKTQEQRSEADDCH
jgi:hypothetical protein